jgi:hypothetical protein
MPTLSSSLSRTSYDPDEMHHEESKKGEAEGGRAIEGEGGSGSFTCRLDSVKDITEVMTCLSTNMKKDLPCTIEAELESLIIMVTGRSKSTQARLTLQADHFDEYAYESPNDTVKLSLNLTALLDCLQLFGSSDSAASTMTYSADDAIFRLSLEDSGILTTCELPGLYVDDEDTANGGLFVTFRESPEECAVLMQSEVMLQHVQELFEVPGATCVRVRFSSTGMSMKVTGADERSCEVEIPRTADIFVSFHFVGAHTVSWAYPIGSLQLALKALGVAKETYLRINSDGLLCAQHQVESKSGREIFLDFLLVAMHDAES